MRINCKAYMYMDSNAKHKLIESGYGSVCKMAGIKLKNCCI